MNNKNIDPLTPLFALLKYKDLARDPTNHSEMIKDKTTVNFLAYVLDSSDEEVLTTSLDTLLLLSENSFNANKIQSTFGVTEALNSVLKRQDIENPAIKDKSMKLLDKYKNSAESPKTAVKKTQQYNKKVLTLHIHGLHMETQKDLENVLTKKVKGILSIIVDVEHQKCTLTVYENVDPKSIAMVISENTNMEAKLISKNKCNQEILVPLLDNDKTIDLQDLPPYLDEKDSPIDEKAVRSAKDIRITASEWFCTAAGFLQKTFYW